MCLYSDDENFPQVSLLVLTPTLRTRCCHYPPRIGESERELRRDLERLLCHFAREEECGSLQEPPS